MPAVIREGGASSFMGRMKGAKGEKGIKGSKWEKKMKGKGKK